MKPDIRQIIGARIRAARITAALTQEELAFRVSIHGDSISLIERGKTLPSITTLMSLAEALHLPITDLIPATSVEAERSLKRVRLEAEIQIVVSGVPENYLELVREQIAALKSHLS